MIFNLSAVADTGPELADSYTKLKAWAVGCRGGNWGVHGFHFSQSWSSASRPASRNPEIKDLKLVVLEKTWCVEIR